MKPWQFDFDSLLESHHQCDYKLRKYGVLLLLLLFSECACVSACQCVCRRCHCRHPVAVETGGGTVEGVCLFVHPCQCVFVFVCADVV